MPGMTDRPRLLFLSQCLPYPPTSGVTNRTYHVLRELQRAFDVTLVAFSRRNHQSTVAARYEAYVELAECLSGVAPPSPIRSEWSALAKVGNHLRSLLSGRCYVDFEYASAEFASRVRSSLLAAPPDLVHIDSLDLHRSLALVGDLPVTCTHHSIESALLRLRADHHPNPLARWYLQLQADRYEALEQRATPGFAANVMMSSTDAFRLREIAPSAPTICVPNGVDVDRLRPIPAIEVEQDLAAFLGPSYMYPNRDGMQYFLTDIWPTLRRRRPEVRLEWIGRVSQSVRSRAERSPGVRCLGFVPSLPEALARASCIIVPLRIGGGTRLKILDAWAMGKAVVSTTVGCEGLSAVDNVNILIRDEPHEFAEAVEQVLSDPILRERLGRGARTTAERSYNWGVIGAEMNRAFRAIIDRGKGLAESGAADLSPGTDPC